VDGSHCAAAAVNHLISHAGKKGASGTCNQRQMAAVLDPPP